MNKIIVILALAFLISCTTEEKALDYYEIIFKNNSQVDFNIKIYNKDGTTEMNQNVSHSAVTNSIQRSNKGFGGFNATIDSIVVRFANGKGYKCVDFWGSTDSKCFLSKSSPLSDDVTSFVKDGSTYIYIVTEQDFQNAFDL